METFTNIVLVVGSIFVPGEFISTLLKLDFLIEFQTLAYGQVVYPSFVVCGVIFWIIILLIYGIFDLTKTGILKLKKITI